MSGGGFMLDAGALIAIDRGDRRMLALLEAARDVDLPIAATAPVVGQVWRDGRRQARLAAFLKQPALNVAAFAAADARAAGELAAICRHADVVDVHVVLLARRRRLTVVTSDPHDMRKVDPLVAIVRV
jgi:predicted nucleic acid-binding protein